VRCFLYIFTLQTEIFLGSHNYSGQEGGHQKHELEDQMRITDDGLSSSWLGKVPVCDKPEYVLLVYYWYSY
jgi:hypothetical protein